MRKPLRMMRKSLWLSGAALLAVAATASIALAAVNVKVLPTASFSGATVTVSGGEFSGLGNTEAFAELTVKGLATYECENPSKKVVPGQNPVEAKAGSSGPVGLGNASNKFGRGTIKTISATVTEPPTPEAKTVGCGGTGNEKWTVKLTSLTATGAQLVIRQPEGGPVVFCRNYTSDGTGTKC